MTEIHNNLPTIKLPFFTVFDWIVIALFCVVVFVFLWKTLHSPQKKNISPIKKDKFIIVEITVTGGKAIEKHIFFKLYKN